jgi:hypothetical protein
MIKVMIVFLLAAVLVYATGCTCACKGTNKTVCPIQTPVAQAVK